MDRHVYVCRREGERGGEGGREGEGEGDREKEERGHVKCVDDVCGPCPVGFVGNGSSCLRM